MDKLNQLAKFTKDNKINASDLLDALAIAVIESHELYTETQAASLLNKIRELKKDLKKS